MSKQGRVPRTKESVISLFISQLEILIDYCCQYDAGKEHYGSEIATKLRVFLNDSGRSTSLITQMNFETPISFLSTHRIVKKDGLAFSSPALCTIQHKIEAGFKAAQSAKYIPHFDSFGGSTSWSSFEDWWQELIILDSSGNEFTRKLLVSEVANTDGGAHIDPNIKLEYDNLLNKNSAGMYLDPTNGIFIANYSEAIKHLSLPPPVMPSIRQVAHELILSFKNNHLELDLPKYSYKNFYDEDIKTI